MGRFTKAAARFEYSPRRPSAPPALCLEGAALIAQGMLGAASLVAPPPARAPLPPPVTRMRKKKKKGGGSERASGAAGSKNRPGGRGAESTALFHPLYRHREMGLSQALNPGKIPMESCLDLGGELNFGGSAGDIALAGNPRPTRLCILLMFLVTGGIPWPNSWRLFRGRLFQPVYRSSLHLWLRAFISGTRPAW